MILSFTDVQALAAQAGLDLAGVAPAGEAPGWARYREWLAAGYAGELAYLARAEALTRRADPRRILPSARSVLVVGAAYGRGALLELPALHGRVARYAWGEDYHRWVLRRLKALVELLRAQLGPFAARCYVDTGPVLERAWAQAAGLGWIGKNACLIHPRLGSFFFLGVALLEADLPPSPAPSLPDCGSCTRCLDACPTGALVAPGVVDARRCLSYLTIEYRGALPPELRPALGEYVLGCDRCQEVCPWNVAPAPARENALSAVEAALYLLDVLRLEEADFRARFRQTALWRATREGLARNAAVVLGNRGDPAARPYLELAARGSPSALVREHARWALARLDR